MKCVFPLNNNDFKLTRNKSENGNARSVFKFKRFDIYNSVLKNRSRTERRTRLEAFLKTNVSILDICFILSI